MIHRSVASRSVIADTLLAMAGQSHGVCAASRAYPGQRRSARRAGCVDGALQLGLDAGQQVAVGVAEGADAFALELGRDGGEIDAGVRGATERLLGRGGARVEGAAGVAVVGEGAQGGLGHGVDDVRGDQLFDVEHVGVGGVLGGGARP